MSFFLPWTYIHKTVRQRNTYSIVICRKNCEKGLIVNEDKIDKATPVQKESLRETYSFRNT